MTVPTIVDFSAKAFSSDAQSVGLLDLAARQFVVAFGIAALDGDLHFVAGLRRLVGRKRRERQNAFGLESDIENDGVGGHSNHRAFASLSARFLLAGMAVLVLGENIFEGFSRLTGGRGFGSGWVGGVRIGQVWIGGLWIGHERG